MRKRLLALFLSAVMVVGLLPSVSFAAEDPIYSTGESVDAGTVTAKGEGFGWSTYGTYVFYVDTGVTYYPVGSDAASKPSAAEQVDALTSIPSFLNSVSEQANYGTYFLPTAEYTPGNVRLCTGGRFQRSGGKYTASEVKYVYASNAGSSVEEKYKGNAYVVEVRGNASSATNVNDKLKDDFSAFVRLISNSIKYGETGRTPSGSYTENEIEWVDYTYGVVTNIGVTAQELADSLSVTAAREIVENVFIYNDTTGLDGGSYKSGLPDARYINFLNDDSVVADWGVFAKDESKALRTWMKHTFIVLACARAGGKDGVDVCESLISGLQCKPTRLYAAVQMPVIMNPCVFGANKLLVATSMQVLHLEEGFQWPQRVGASSWSGYTEAYTSGGGDLSGFGDFLWRKGCGEGVGYFTRPFTLGEVSTWAQKFGADEWTSHYWDNYIPRGYQYFLSTAAMPDSSGTQAEGVKVITDPGTVGVEDIIGYEEKRERFPASVQFSANCERVPDNIVEAGETSVNFQCAPWLSFEPTSFVRADGRIAFGVRDARSLARAVAQYKSLLSAYERPVDIESQISAIESSGIDTSDSDVASVLNQLRSLSNIQTGSYRYTAGDLSLIVYLKAGTNVQISVADASAAKEYTRGYYGNGKQEETHIDVPGSSGHSVTYVYTNDGVPKNEAEWWPGSSTHAGQTISKMINTGQPQTQLPGLVAEAWKPQVTAMGCSIKDVTDYSFTISVDDIDKFYTELCSGNTVISCTSPVTLTVSVSADAETEITNWVYGAVNVSWINFPVAVEHSYTYEIVSHEATTTIEHYTKDADGNISVVGEPETTRSGVEARLADHVTVTNVVPETWEGSALMCNCLMDTKYDYDTLAVVDPNYPQYHSVADPNPHTEFNQGTIEDGAKGPTGDFNSMTGTPTFTATEREELMNSDYYGSDGHYYQYFAAGGTEFVVEFDGEFHHDETATRTFTFQWNTTTCADDGSGGGHNGCDAHSLGGDPETFCSCGHCLDDTVVHHQCGTSMIYPTTLSFQIQYTGLDYVEITNLKVWQLSEARLDGTYTLLEQDHVTATIQNTATAISYNIAGANTAEAGRMVYEFCPTGAAEKSGAFTASGDRDNLVWTKTTNNSCKGYAQANLNEVKAVLDGAKDGAYMVSDYIVLHTSDGAESILYYQKQTTSSQNIVASWGQWKDGECTAIGAGGSSTSQPSDCTMTQTRTSVEFAPTTSEELWENNSQASYEWDPEGVTYGGYNGDYMSRSTKYTSHETNPNNIEWNSDIVAAKNISGVFGTRGWNAGEYSQPAGFKPSTTLRVMKDKLIIPDTRANGQYDFIKSQVFYKNLVYYEKTTCKHPSYETNYSRNNCGDFGNQYGFTMNAGYGSPTYKMVCNGIVVYDPVSTQEAMIVPLDEALDQRVGATGVDAVPVVMCPGDSSCEYQELSCTRTDHMHTSDCYSYEVYTVHAGGYNAHEHIYPDPWDITGKTMLECPYHMETPVTTYTIRHSSGCSYEGEVHTSTSATTCTQCGHGSGCIASATPNYASGTGTCDCYHCGNPACGSNYCSNHQYACSATCQIAHPTPIKVYDCGDLPLNTHVCVAPSVGAQTFTATYTYAAAGTNVYSFTATAAGQVVFESTSYTADPRGVIYVNGTQVVDNDDSGDGLNFKAVYNVNVGDSVTLRIYQYGSTGGGTCNCTITIPGKESLGCYKTTTPTLACTDPHHTWDTDWHVYTTGMMHKDGTVCKGYGCTNTTDINLYLNTYTPVSTIKTYHIVQHTSGVRHLSAVGGPCSTCGQAYIKDCGLCTSTTRTLTTTEIANETGHYDYGDTRCWQACGKAENHNAPTTLATTGSGDEPAKFLVLDHEFTLKFPNVGDFYGTGCRACGSCSAERGMGYDDWPGGSYCGLDAEGRNSSWDTTQWIKYKWVEFPFDVIYNGDMYLTGERVYLKVPEVYFEFYIPLENIELANEPIRFCVTAINDSSPLTINSQDNEYKNTRVIGDNSHEHDANKLFKIDLIGRIGALTINDTGDFRYSNFFKQTVSQWLVTNVIRRVNTGVQNCIVMDSEDVRNVALSEAEFKIGSSAQKALYDFMGNGNVAGDTYGLHSERHNINKIFDFLLTPQYLATAKGASAPYNNNQASLARQPVRIGYDAYMDVTTIGNYYDNVTVSPHYFKLEWEDDGSAYSLTPADVYMNNSGKWVAVNLYGAENVTQDNNTAVSMNWVEEAPRRNYNDVEEKNTKDVYSQVGIGMPYGSKWTYGTYDFLNLTGRNRTCIGFPETYGLNTNPANRVKTLYYYYMQGGRWHFNLGLPSSAVFVKAGNPCTQENIDAFAVNSDHAVIVCGLEIYAYGEVWTLRYDGDTLSSKTFNITPDVTGLTPLTDTKFDDLFVYQDKWGEDLTKTVESGVPLLVAEIISINHSSSEDMNTSGTH